MPLHGGNKQHVVHFLNSRRQVAFFSSLVLKKHYAMNYQIYQEKRKISSGIENP